MGAGSSSTDINAAIDTKLSSWSSQLSNYVQKTDLANYPTKTDLASNYAMKTDIPANLAVKADLLPYALKTDLPTNYAMKTDLTPYALKTDIPSNLASKSDLTPYALKTDLPTNYAMKTDLTPYALKTDLPTNYAMKTDLSSYALKTDLPSLAPYAMKTDLTPYALKTDITNHALKSDIPSLTGYALKTDIPSNFVTKTDLTPYALKTDLPTLSTYLTKSDFESQMTTRSLWCSADGTVCTSPPGAPKTIITVSPQMTSDTFNATDGTYVSSASSTWGTGMAYRAFNTSQGVWMSNSPSYTSGNYTGNVNTTVSGTVWAGEWIQIKLPYSLVLTSFKITPHPDAGRPESVSPRVFAIAGSNNGTDWYMVHNQSTPVTNWTLNVTQTFAVSNPSNAAYTYYRLITNQVGNVPGTAASNVVSIGKLFLMGYKA